MKHPNAIPGANADSLGDEDLRIKRIGNQLIIQSRTATVVLLAERWSDVVCAIEEVCNGSIPGGSPRV